MSSTQHTPGLLDAIRTAAADCRAQGNTMAANELLDAAAKASALLAEVAALKALRDELVGALRDVIGWVPVGRTFWHTDAPLKSADRARAVLAKHAGSAS